jgi:hypothetical protein
MWEDNMKMCLREIGRESVDWSDVEHNEDKWQTLANIVMNFQVPYNVANFLTR